jgi:hypothetical protein
VDLEYQDNRPDVSTDYTYGHADTTARRLVAIVVKHGSELLRTYELTYDDQDWFSVLASVTLVAYDGERLHAMIAESRADAKAGKGIPAEEMLDELESLVMRIKWCPRHPAVVPRASGHVGRWACTPGHGTFCVARFILSVYNSTDECKCGTFDLMEALACWETHHRAAFLEWARNPWWP